MSIYYVISIVIGAVGGLFAWIWVERKNKRSVERELEQLKSEKKFSKLNNEVHSSKKDAKKVRSLYEKRRKEFDDFVNTHRSTEVERTANKKTKQRSERVHKKVSKGAKRSRQND